MDTTGLDELTRLLHDEQAVTAQLMTFLQVGEGRGWLTQNAQAGELEVAVDDLRGAERALRRTRLLALGSVLRSETDDADPTPDEWESGESLLDFWDEHPEIETFTEARAAFDN